MQQLSSQKQGFDPLLLSKLRYGRGMFAALDQSGGSTPAALVRYGVDGMSSTDSGASVLYSVDS